MQFIHNRYRLIYLMLLIVKLIPLTVPLSNWIDAINCSEFLLYSAYIQLFIENNSYIGKKYL